MQYYMYRKMGSISHCMNPTSTNYAHVQYCKSTKLRCSVRAFVISCDLLFERDRILTQQVPYMLQHNNVHHTCTCTYMHFIWLLMQHVYMIIYRETFFRVLNIWIIWRLTFNPPWRPSRPQSSPRLLYPLHKSM